MSSRSSPPTSSTFACINETVLAWLIIFPAVCFTLTLGTDVLYWRTANLMWLEFSTWLLLAGMVTGVAALPFGTISFFVTRKRRRMGASSWAYAGGQIFTLALALLNNLIHAADGWTAIMPWGLTLSAMTVLVMFITGLLPFLRADPDLLEERHHA